MRYEFPHFQFSTFHFQLIFHFPCPIFPFPLKKIKLFCGLTESLYIYIVVYAIVNASQNNLASYLLK